MTMSHNYAKSNGASSVSQPPVSSNGPSGPPGRSKKPIWDDTVHDLTEYRATSDELSQRSAAHVSKNLKVAQRQLQEKRIRDGISKPSASGKSGVVVHEIISSMDEISGMIEESNRVLAEAKHLLRNHKNNL